MRHIVTFSYGIASWCAAKLCARRFGVENIELICTDTNYEDADTYAWGEAAAKNVGARLRVIADGRTPWQVFMDTRMIGNTRADPCSRVLKRELLINWLVANCDPLDTTVYFGIHWSEADRFSRFDRKLQRNVGIKHRLAAFGWQADSPLLWKPWIGYDEMHEWAKREGLWQQALYAEGWPHANCGGRCVKQGQKGWKHLLEKRPAAYLECERQEEAVRQHLGKDVAILRDRKGGTTKPMTLRTFRLRLQEGLACDDEEGFGGCNCFGGIEGVDPEA